MANLRADNLCGSGGRNAIDGSLLFNSDGHASTNNINALALADSNDWHFDGDFTIECWINRGKIPTTSGAFLGQWESGGGTDRNVQLYVDTNGVVNGYMNRSTTNYQATSVGALSSGEWHHIALVLEGSTLRFYWNGKQTQTASVSGTQNNSTVKFWVGAEDNGSGSPTYAFNGYLSNVRVIKGISLYKSGNTFTPPTEKLKPIDGTVLLCCQDSDNALQEATGKTITGYGNLSAGTELLSNGNWSNGTTGWTASSGTWTASGGTVSTSGEDIALDQTITTQIGAQYRLKYEIVTNYSNAQNGIYIRDADGSSYVDSRQNNVTGQFEFVFTARESSHRIRLYNGGTSEIKFGIISVIPNNFTAPKVIPPVGVDDGVVFDGDVKINSPNYMYFPTGDTAQRGRGTALYGGGYKTPNSITAIDYLSIQSGGLTEEWGNLSTTALASGAALGSSTRWVTAGGWTGANNNAIEYVTFTTSGNSKEFGDLVVGRRNTAAVSNSTRGIWGGGYISPSDAGTDSIDYVTITSTGNAQDFGNLSAASKSGGVAGSTTRAVFALGLVAPADNNTLEYVTIATTGNYTNFGDMPSGSNGREVSGCSSNVRGIYGGGQYPTEVNIINYITIATTGDAVDFGDLTLARSQTGATSNGTRGVFMGGTTHPARQDTIDSVIIATTGNAVNWGDFRTAKQGLNSAASDSHGGIS